MDIGEIFQTHFGDDTAEIGQSHEEPSRRIDTDYFSGNSETHCGGSQTISGEATGHHFEGLRAACALGIINRYGSSHRPA
jgi:hypothetical protein